MGTLSRYTANDLDFLMDAIEKTSIGLGPTLKRLDVTNGSNRSYPPYNIIKNSEENWEIEMALAGWDKDDIDFLGELFAKDDVNSAGFAVSEATWRSLWSLFKSTDTVAPPPAHCEAASATA